MRVRKSS